MAAQKMIADSRSITMSNIIKLLPDSVANQIAAGEVVQRPASVVKELVENAVDADSSCIKVIIREAGRSLIQVIDNGKGMSEMDARMSFERHATSKITSSNDLFAIRTKGFRGEALASIAAVAQVELRTRARGEELGTYVGVAGSVFDDAETIHCPEGSNFMVKNLFFNVPARRKFLKKNSTEFTHIINEFTRVAMAHPDVEFSLLHNDVLVYDLPSTNLRQRINHLIDSKKSTTGLVPVNAETPFVIVSGFVGKPESAKKTTGEQFFFVNQRFVRHPYLHKAILEAYDNLIPGDAIPSYFIFMEVNPEVIDINIHPTKTEIKFEDERTIWHTINAAVRESLGKFNVVPSIDFDTAGMLDMPLMEQDNDDLVVPGIAINPTYNPFDVSSQTPRASGGSFSSRPSAAGWDSLYNHFETETFTSKMFDEEVDAADEAPLPHAETVVQQQIEHQHATPSAVTSASAFFQFKGRYIMTPVKSGLMMIDQKRAHERILFERFLRQMENHKSASQQILFPEVLTFKAEDAMVLSELLDELQTVGIDIDENEDGDFEIKGLPADLEGVVVRDMLETIIEDYRSSEYDAMLDLHKRVASTLARKSAMDYGRYLTAVEMQELFDSLFACATPNYSPDGKPIVVIVPNDELEQRFQ
ncbi:DNA mismatch repair protein MutL [Breznakibacter xylanolyticus]|uniref:DNA mismatch repair protein MutL n=2 Tax=Breznakibacter xylanolyticus TaxID=990 RepID=A0A2W7P725_9BACT|nr:DNA mismatch repair protein MutL [Breznakibacter xylanolyticus]